MGIPIWRPPTPPTAGPVLSPTTAHRIAMRRRRGLTYRERSSQTLLNLLRNHNSGSSSSNSESSSTTAATTSSSPSARDRLTSQIWRELNSLPPPAREAVFLPLPIPTRVPARFSISDENARPAPPARATRPAPPPPPPPPPQLYRFGPSSLDGLGDRERSLSPDAQSHTWATLLPDDIGFATACDLDLLDEDAELLGLGLGLGPGGIEEALMEFRRRREARDEEERELREASVALQRARERLVANTRL